MLKLLCGILASWTRPLLVERRLVAQEGLIAYSLPLQVRALKAALPLLQDHVRDELQGGSRRAAESRRATPTRKRRTAGPSARQDGQSSEDAGSEGG